MFHGWMLYYWVPEFLRTFRRARTYILLTPGTSAPLHPQITVRPGAPIVPSGSYDRLDETAQKPVPRLEGSGATANNPVKTCSSFPTVGGTFPTGCRPRVGRKVALPGLGVLHALGFA